MSEQPKMNQDWLDEISNNLEVMAKYSRTLANWWQGAFDHASDLMNNPPAKALHTKSETTLCIFPRAPVAKIIECIAGGGLVIAIFGSRAEWIASATKGKPGIPSGQIIECSESQATIKFNDNETIIVKNPGEKILFVAMFWVGA